MTDTQQPPPAPDGAAPVRAKASAGLDLPPVAPGGPAERRRKGGRFGPLMLLSLPFILVFLLFVGLAVTHRALALPGWVVTQVETRANAALAGQMRVRIVEGADVIVDEGVRPRIRFHGVTLMRPDGRPLAHLPELRTTLFAQPLLRGKVVPRSFRVRGAEVALARLPDGRLDIELGPGGDFAEMEGVSLTQLLAAFEGLFGLPGLRDLERIEGEDLRIRLTDQRLDRVWNVRDGTVTLTQDAREISILLAFGIGGEGEVPARVAITGSTSKAGLEANFSANVTNVNARDLAVQTPALAPLQVVDAPISGSLRSGIDGQGRLSRMNAVLEIGPGAIRPDPRVEQVPMRGAKVYLEYDPQAGQMRFTDLSFDSRALRLRASGQTLLRDLQGGLPRQVIGQVEIADLQLDPEGLFEAPAIFTGGAVDLRLSFDPFALEIGQMQLLDGDTRLTATGTARVLPEGWQVAVDSRINQVSSERLIQLWPTFVVPKTRDWVAQNVSTGELRNVRAALRTRPKQDPELALNYEFRGAEVQVLRTLPKVQEGRGFAAIFGQRHGLMVEEGHVVPPSGGKVEVADTVLVVPDLRIKPAPAVVNLLTRSPIPAALSLLDQPPFEFLTKAGRPTDLAQGWAEALTILHLPLAEHLAPEDVVFEVAARLTDVTSDQVVPGRELRAPQLDLRADRETLSIAGAGTLSEVPFEAEWRQPLAAEAKGRSQVDGRLLLSQAALDAFEIRMPQGMVSGEGWADLHLDLSSEAPTRYRLTSRLEGIGLALPQIGWALGKGTTARLELDGALGAPASVERLSFAGPGLKAEGALSLLPEGGLERARFSELDIGSWFSGSAELIGRGNAAPDVVVTGGQFDLRNFPGGGAASGQGDAGQIMVSLDGLRVSDSIQLTDVRGTFSTRGGMNGKFTGEVNGRGPLRGTVAPAENGRAAVRVLSDDAGRVLRSAGVFDRGRGGALDLTLLPVGANDYDGKLKMTDFRVKDAPVLATMLGAASVIGLVEQLNGDGILFSEVSGRFLLTDQGVQIRRGDAVGASMGVTMTGNFYPASGKIDMQGVVSPFYLVNGIGQVLTRRGEGLFGFNYTLTGMQLAPVVTVNPFSLFTPGMFREIFRRDPPPLAQE